MNRAILVTARLKSERLPRKVLKELQGRPALAHLVDRLRGSGSGNRILLCTSTLEEDDPLAEAAGEMNLDVYRGDPDDVLLRLTMAAEGANVEAIFNCTADNLFIDPGYLDRQLDLLERENLDYVYCYDLPVGAFGWALRVPAMRRACDIKNEWNTEIWGRYFTDTGLFRFAEMEVDEADRWKGLRLTLDTPEDWQVIRAVFDALYRPGEVFSLQELIAFCRANPELLAINAGCVQRMGDPVKLKSKP